MDPLTSIQAADPQNAQLARELYDALMAEIEPDLLLINLPTLDEKYAGEAPADHDARMKRYEAAYAKFDHEFQTFMAEVGTEVRTSRRQSLKEKEQASVQSDQPVLASLEEAFR